MSDYLGYAIGETVLIVVGILLALQISEWNQTRKDRLEETGILQRLRVEFKKNQERLTICRQAWEDISDSMDTLVELTRPDPDSHPDDLVDRLMGRRHWTAGFDPNTSALNSLLSSGKIALIENELLGNYLNAWMPELEFFQRRALRDESQKDMYSSCLVKHYQFRDTTSTADFAGDSWGGSYFHATSERFYRSPCSNPRQQTSVLWRLFYYPISPNLRTSSNPSSTSSTPRFRNGKARVIR